MSKSAEHQNSENQFAAGVKQEESDSNSMYLTDSRASSSQFKFMSSIIGNSAQHKKVSQYQKIANSVTQRNSDGIGTFIIEDSQSVEAGQLTKTVFLTKLMGEISSVASETLSKIGQSVSDCPYIPYWFHLYGEKNLAEMQSSIGKFAPQTTSANSVENYIAAIVVKVKTSFENFVSSGNVSGVPAELPKLHDETATPPMQKMDASAIAQLCGGGEEEMTSFTTTGGELWDDDNPSKGYLDDDFDTIKKQLKSTSSYGSVLSAVTKGKSNDVILWRGTNEGAVNSMVANQSAGAGANSGAQKPGHDDVQEQVGSGAHFPEFTSDMDASWSAGSWLVVVKINTKYLAKGSSNEQGFICDRSAPLEVLSTVDRTAITTGKIKANAS